MVGENVRRLLAELPAGVELVVVAKGREPHQVLEAVEAGVRIVGENYVQEAERAFAVVGDRVKWHFIGRLQKNKVRKAVKVFDMIETLDSLEMAGEINRKCGEIGKVMPVLVEVNSGREGAKSGVFPEQVEDLVQSVSNLANIKVMGLMTMGPRTGDPEESRPYFMETRRVMDRLKALKLPNADLEYLSMGMSNSYRVAIEEGANLVRIGRKIFEGE